MKTMFACILALAAVVSCSQAASTDMPEWRWKDPEPPEETPAQEPHPALIENGWTNVTGNFAALPEGIAIYRAPEDIGGNKTVAFMAVADMSKINWDVLSIDDPKISGTTEKLKTPAEYFQETGAPVIVNGGYFFSEGGKQYNASVAVSDGRFYGVNINYASLDWETFYYPTRGVFYQNDSGTPATGWTYWTGGAAHYLYNKPAQNSWSNDPLQTPDANFPVKAENFAPKTAIGAGPVLLKGGEVVNSWEAELFYGNSSDDKMPEARHPRTVIAWHPDGLLIIFVCEGRGMTDGVAGMTFAEEAALMKALGCTEALNLDGGGSSCLLIQGKETIKVSDGEQRPVGSVIVLKAK